MGGGGGERVGKTGKDMGGGRTGGKGKNTTDGNGHNNHNRNNNKNSTIGGKYNKSKEG